MTSGRRAPYFARSGQVPGRVFVLESRRIKSYLLNNRRDKPLDATGRHVQDYKCLNPSTARGIAVREFRLKAGFVDYLLNVDRYSIGSVEVKLSVTRDDLNNIFLD